MEAHGSIAVKALYYKPECHGFETRRDERISLIYIMLPTILGPGVHSASNRNEYQKQTNNVSGSKAWPVRRADKLEAICEPVV
jgi:hypothetical protein